MRLFFTRMTAFQIPNTPDDSWGGTREIHCEQKNKFLYLVRKLFQTEYQDMCKVSEDGFSGVPAVLMVLIHLGVETEKFGLGGACSYKPMKMMTNNPKLHIGGWFACDIFLREIVHLWHFLSFMLAA